MPGREPKLLQMTKKDRKEKRKKENVTDVLLLHPLRLRGA